MSILSTKKFAISALAALSLALTGCLTDEDKDTTPTDPSVKITFESTNDTIWNVIGPNKGAVDLVADSAVSASGPETNKDVRDMTTTATGVFPGTLTAGTGNGTMFVMAAAGFDYANATDSSVIKGYAAGTSVATTPVLMANDIILAKLRGGPKYVVIKITAVVTTTTDNKDYIAFSYKRTP